MSKVTFLILAGVFAMMLLAPHPDGKGNIITAILPEANAQLPVLNITSTIDAPCVKEEPQGTGVDLLPLPDGDGLDDTTGKPICACFESATCNVFESPLDAMLEPFFSAFSFAGEESGQFFLIAIWGLIVGIIWLRTSSTMITGVVGIGVATVFTFNERTILVGMTLLGAAIGIIVYQLYKQRLDFPTN